MTREPVQSSNIVSVGYDPATQTLEIEFKGGGVHQYSGVPADKHAAFMKARSVGGYFYQHIRNYHEGNKI